MKNENMLICKQCGSVYFVSNIELFKQCESCGGKLVKEEDNLNG